MKRNIVRQVWVVAWLLACASASGPAAGAQPVQEAQQNSIRGQEKAFAGSFVSGHEFTRAESRLEPTGLQPNVTYFLSGEHEFLRLKCPVILSGSEGPRQYVNIPRQIKRQLGNARFFPSFACKVSDIRLQPLLTVFARKIDSSGNLSNPVPDFSLATQAVAVLTDGTGPVPWCFPGDPCANDAPDTLTTVLTDGTAPCANDALNASKAVLKDGGGPYPTCYPPQQCRRQRAE
jgi:hypothetical protein